MSESKSLLELVIAHKSLEEELISVDGEITHELQLRVLETLFSNQVEIAKKSDNYFWKCEKVWRPTAKVFREIAERARSRAKSLESLEVAAKARMKSAMETLGVNEILGETTRTWRYRAKSAVVVTDESLLPAKYARQKITVEYDLDQIKRDIDAGIDVPGATLKESWAIKSESRQEREV